MDNLKFPSLSKIQIVDVGASALDGVPVYQKLLDIGSAFITGFEPNQTELFKLQQLAIPHTRYLGYALGDGDDHIYYMCKAPGMNSLLEPDPECLRYYHGFETWGEVVSKHSIKTHRMDEINEIEDIDFLKLDVQGAECMILENASKRLEQCMVIHTEVNFSPFYKNHPLFSDVDFLLRKMGFTFHCFFPLVKRMIKPLMKGSDMYGGIHHTVWADAVYFRDLKDVSKLFPDKILKTAMIMHHVYQSYDLVLRFLWEHDRLKNSLYSTEYLKTLRNF